MNLNLETARHNMIEQQIRPWNVLDPVVLQSLQCLRREDFVPEQYKALAFSDLEVPLGRGQCMYSPKLEARLMQALSPQRGDNVLEVGTGSGYMAALLSTQAQRVLSFEIVPELAATAQRNLEMAGVDHVEIMAGDGLPGNPERAPYDAIMLSGGVPQVPVDLLHQLKTGGRLVAVVGVYPLMRAQLYRRDENNTFSCATLFETAVPMLENIAQQDNFSL